MKRGGRDARDEYLKKIMRNTVVCNEMTSWFTIYTKFFRQDSKDLINIMKGKQHNLHRQELIFVCMHIGLMIFKFF
ncbi:hypothetical protein RCL_jg10980.t1 [Rhizophagus clarus]|uniref:Uncharacterized protein n=1 Tax=Rhizophagus clarus TaxID=94130 RepID=A0A8H3L7P1_9GLOM|nr:hypothetical protein RCL_jg10980.t1 [Rhizophagus clarus]